MKKLLSALLLTIGIVSLTSCGDGGSSSNSNSSTTGSTQFYVSNNDKVDYARVDIEDNSGNIQSSTPIYCSAQLDCSFKANMPAAGSLLFYDKNNTMVNAYILTYAPSDIQFVSTSLNMLGMYLLSSYDDVTSEDLVIDYRHLASFFANYTSTDPNLGTNYLTLMAKYYQLQTIGTGLSYKDFITNLNNSVSSGSVLPANQLISGTTDYFKQFLALFKTSPLIASAYAANPSLDNTNWSPCSNLFTNNLPRTLGASAKFLEGAAKTTFVTGAAFEVVSTVWGDACKAPDKKMQEINQKLDEIRAAQQQLADKFDGATQFFTAANLNNQLKEMDNNLQIITDATSAYTQIKKLSPNGDLTQYISNQGGLEKAWKDSSNIKKIFDFPTIWNATKAVLNSNKELFRDGLNVKCGLDDRASIDLAIARARCNVAIKKFQASVSSAGIQAQVLLRDVTNALSSYSTAESIFVGQNIIPPDNISPDISNGSEDWRNYFTNKLENLLKNGMDAGQFGFAEKLETITDGTPYFDVYGDISTDLRTSLISAGCVNPDDGAALNIQRWIRNGVNSYVNVGCKKDGAYYNSKYLYKRDGNNVRNVLGVIVSQNLIGSTRNLSNYSINTNDRNSGLRLIIDKSQNLSYTDQSGNFLTINYDNNDIATVWFFGKEHDSFTFWFSLTDRTPEKNSWIFRLSQLQMGIVAIDCYITSACGLGATNNAIGFGAWGGPDPVIVNVQQEQKSDTNKRFKYYNFKLPTDDPKISSKLANY